MSFLVVIVNAVDSTLILISVIVLSQWHVELSLGLSALLSPYHEHDISQHLSMAMNPMTSFHDRRIAIVELKKSCHLVTWGPSNDITYICGKVLCLQTYTTGSFIQAELMQLYRFHNDQQYKNITVYPSLSEGVGEKFTIKQINMIGCQQPLTSHVDCILWLLHFSLVLDLNLVLFCSPVSPAAIVFTKHERCITSGFV
jgi:hypothetical protein